MDTYASGIEASPSRFCSRWLFAALFAIAASARAAPVSGQFVLNGKAFSPTNIAAFYIADEAHPEKFETLVLLSTQAVDNDAIARSSSPSSKAMNDPAMKNGSITFYIEPEGKVTMLAAIDGTQFMDTNGMIMGQKGSLEATCAKNTREHIACSIKSRQPVTLNGTTWTLDETIDVPVVPSHAANK
jgi:hypothetical protein